MLVIAFLLGWGLVGTGVVLAVLEVTKRLRRHGVKMSPMKRDRHPGEVGQ